MTAGAALGPWRQAAAAALPPLHRGFNTFPWLYRARLINNDPQHFDLSDPFPYLGRYKSGDFAALRQAGADLVRVPLEPGPFVLADPAARAALIGRVLAAAQRVTQAGMTMIVDLHPHEGLRGWGAADILASPELLAGYTSTVVDFARAIAQRGGGRLVLELMNEPQGGWHANEGAAWLDIQPALVRAVRQVAPTLPIIATGDRGGGIDGLLRLDPSGFDDPMILYSFHYYDPMVITHQGASWGMNKTRRYLQHLAYPPAPEQETSQLDQLQTRIMSDATLPETERAPLVRQTSAAVGEYFQRGQGIDRIRSDFGRVVAWGKRYGIANSRITLGEFGVYRPGASPDTVANYAHDVRTVAESLGFPWAYFNYAPFDENGAGFSVLQMQGPTPNAFDKEIMNRGLGLGVP